MSRVRICFAVETEDDGLPCWMPSTQTRHIPVGNILVGVMLCHEHAKEAGWT